MAGLTDFFSVLLDATGAYAQGYPTSQLSYLWTDLFGGVGTFPTYAFKVTRAQLGTSLTTSVTLVVTDPAARSRTIVIPVSFA